MKTVKGKSESDIMVFFLLWHGLNFCRDGIMTKEVHLDILKNRM